MMAKPGMRLFFFLTACFLTCSTDLIPAIADDFSNREQPLNQFGIPSSNPYVVNRFTVGGKIVDEIIVPGPPSPPAGVIREFVAALPEPDAAAGVNIISNVPASTWAFGCSATSASMMFGHFDNAGYPNMYSGPTNGGVFPMTNAVWGTVSINGETRALNPLSATRNGLDGRSINGHVDDYWVKYGDTGFDPFSGNWPEHTKGECTADFMGTNQYAFGNSDGSTSFYNYQDGSPLYDFTYYEPNKRDGCHGMKLFVESRGYSVQNLGNFNQYILGSSACNPAPCTQGFTYENFKAEIDAGRPVLIQVTGHTMLGFGYSDPATIYVHDTWDYLDHTMTWGGTYSNMTHYAVTVLRLNPAVTTGDVTVLSATSAFGGGNVTADGGGTIISRGVCWGTSVNPTTANNCTNDGTGLGVFTSSISGLSAGTTYHLRAYAAISAGTGYGSDITFFSLCGSPAAKAGGIIYSSINQALQNALSGTVILADAAQFGEDVSFTQSGMLSIQGGYDCAFNTIPAKSIIRSIIIAGTGSLALDNIIIQ